MKYEYLGDAERRQLIEQRLKTLEVEHFHITSMLKVGNENRDPALGPTIGLPDGPPPLERVAKLEDEHAFLKAELATLAPATDPVDSANQTSTEGARP